MRNQLGVEPGGERQYAEQQSFPVLRVRGGNGRISRVGRLSHPIPESRRVEEGHLGREVQLEDLIDLIPHLPSEYRRVQRILHPIASPRSRILDLACPLPAFRIAFRSGSRRIRTLRCRRRTRRRVRTLPAALEASLASRIDTGIHAYRGSASCHTTPDTTGLHLTLLRRQREHAIELRTIFWGFFSSSPPREAPLVPSSGLREPGLGSADAILARWSWEGDEGCR